MRLLGDNTHQGRNIKSGAGRPKPSLSFSRQTMPEPKKAIDPRDRSDSRNGALKFG